MRLTAVLMTVALSAAGMGLVMPCCPQLLGSLGSLGARGGGGWRYGAFLAL